MGRTFSPKLVNSIFEPKSLHESDPNFSISESRATDEQPFMEKWSKTDGAALAKAFKQGQPT